jgi:AraC-like DNA-binding protein
MPSPATGIPHDAHNNRLPGLTELIDRQMLGAEQRLQINDAQEASTCLQSIYSANRLHLLGHAGDFAMHLQVKTLGRLELASLSFGAEVQLDQAPLQRTLLISTQVQGWAQVETANNRQQGGAGLMVIDPLDAAIHKRFSADSRRFHVRVPYAALEHKCAELLGRSLHKPLTFQPFVKSDCAAQRNWLNLLPVLLGHLNMPLTPASRAMSSALEDMVLLTLLNEQPHNYQEALAATVAPLAPRHVRRAEAYMREHAATPLSLSVIAEAVGVSVRTLCDGFQRSRQQSPMQVLNGIRLDSVHDELRNAPPRASVVAIAERWGFSHAGRFARAYQTRFGELPSATLRRG